MRSAYCISETEASCTLLQRLAYEDRKMTPDENKEFNNLDGEVIAAVEEYRTQKLKLTEMRTANAPVTDTNKNPYRCLLIWEHFFENDDMLKRRARRRGELPHMIDARAQECKEKGNCCARACGCCAKPRANLGLQEGDEMYSHCTEYCVCCESFYQRLAAEP